MTDPKLYKGKQVILNSGRLLLNAKDDAVLLFAKKEISLSTVESVHINCSALPGFIVNAPQIHLGLPPKFKGDSIPYISDKLPGQHSQEYRIIKGETLRNALLILLDNLKDITSAMDGDYPFSLQALSLAEDIDQIKKDIENSLSKQNFVV